MQTHQPPITSSLLVTSTLMVEQQQQQTLINPANRQPLTAGMFREYGLSDGLRLVLSQATEQHHAKVRFIAPASVMLLLVLEGELTFAYDGQSFALNAHQGPQALIVNCATDVHFSRQLQPQRSVKRLHLWLPSQYFARFANSAVAQQLQQRLTAHLASALLPVNNHCAQLALQLFALNGDELVQNWQRQALVFELLAQLLPQLTQADWHSAKQQHQFSFALMHYIEAHLHQALQVKQMAAHFACSVSSLQRHAKKHFGCTLPCYIRQQRLTRAHRLLSEQPCNVAAVALQVGYQHDSNFVSAFKQHYGYTPGELQLRIKRRSG